MMSELTVENPLNSMRTETYEHGGEETIQFKIFLSKRTQPSPASFESDQPKIWASCYIWGDLF